MPLSRRDFGRLAVASLARSLPGAMIDSKINGVQMGAITYSFNSIANPDPQAIIRAFVEIGLGEAELMSNHCEALAGAPGAGRGRRGGQLTAEEQAARQAGSAGSAQELADVYQRHYVEGRSSKIQR